VKVVLQLAQVGAASDRNKEAVKFPIVAFKETLGVVEGNPVKLSEGDGVILAKLL